MKAGRVLLMAMALTGLSLFLATAQIVPQLINYQGRLTNATGLPINTTVPMHFALMDGDTNTAAVLWGETQSSVSVSQGIYNVLLGSVHPVPPSALSGATVFLEVKVSGETLKPRQRLTSVAYAYRAVNAANSQNLGGQAAGQFYSKTEVDNLLAAMQTQINTLQSQTTTNTSNIATNTSTIGTHTTHLSGLDTRITTDESEIGTLQTQETDHEARISTAETKLLPVSVVGSDFIFTNVNVNIRSGNGATNATINGRGNLILGYNENSSNTRTG